jgi:DNA-binding IscR family transcriptional regulator
MTNTNEISINDVQNYEITLQDILDLLDKKYQLFYCDYNDNLDENLEEIQECIRKQKWDSLYESIDEWVSDCSMYSLDYIYAEIAKQISREYDCDRDEAEEILDTHWDSVRDEIYNRDTSTPIADLLHNTRDIVMFYDTGVEIYNGCLSPQKEVDDMVKEIKKTLKIKLSEKKWDDAIDMMVRQGDSGRLVIYFNADVNQMMDLKDKNVVTFSNPSIAIANTWNGSGDDCELMGHKFTIPFDLKEFYIDKLIRYNYTYAVCGMNSRWCENTGVSFGKKNLKKK